MRDDYTPEETAYWNGRADERKEWEDKIKAKIEEYEEKIKKLWEKCDKTYKESLEKCERIKI